MELNRKAKMIKQRGFLLFFMLAAGIVRLCFLADLPINAHPSAGADDGLLYNLARSLVAGDWLGDYNHFTMVKGPVFSLFLAACNLTGIPFLVAESIIYTAGCILITVSVNKLFKKNWQFACFYLLLLLNPIASAARTYQTVYRNGIVLGLELMVIAFYITLYLNHYRRADWILAAVCSIAYALMKYTRDDSMWILPFMVAASAITVVKNIIHRERKVCLVKKAILLICPFIVSWGLENAISMKNEATYGIYGVTDSKGTNFSKALDLMYSIDCDTELQRVSITRDKLERLYEASPTLAGIRGKLDNQVSAWTTLNRDTGSGEIEGTLFYWALRAAVAESGYYTDGRLAEAFYGKVYDELAKEVEDGILNKGNSMPSIFMQPWKKGYGSLLFQQMINANTFIVTYEDVVTYGLDMPDYGETDSDREEMAEFCHSNIIYKEDALNDPHYLNSVDFKVGIINSFTQIWALIHPALWITALIRLIYLSIQGIRRCFYQNYEWLDKIIITWGLLLTYLVIIAGVSYVEISDYAAINYKYLSPAYPVIGIVEGIILFNDMDILIMTLKEKRRIKRNGTDNSNALPK